MLKHQFGPPYCRVHIYEKTKAHQERESALMESLPNYMVLGQCNSDNGHCVKMEERCNQMPDCEDDSDEMNCKILVLKKGYNMRVPPVGTTGRGVKKLKPVPVKISLTLYKVVAIEEEDHSIALQFQINLAPPSTRELYWSRKNTEPI